MIGKIFPFALDDYNNVAMHKKKRHIHCPVEDGATASCLF